MVLGEYLSKNGHLVKVSSAEMYKGLAENYEVQFQGFKGDYASIVDDEALRRAIGKNPFTVGRALKEKVYPIIENSLETFNELANWADVVLYHPKTMIDGIGEPFKDKLIKAYVVPAFTPTQEFINPILSFLRLPKWINKYTYWFADLAMKSFSRPVKNFRRKNNLTQEKDILETPVIYGISPSFLERPADYPQEAHFTGFWIRASTNQELPDDLTKFLAGDVPVLLITFGSMPYRSKTDINKFIRAIRVSVNVKVLIVRGWGLRDVEIEENEMIKSVASSPFDVLFPKIDFAIHHGGAGTTAIALKSGLPQMVLPVLHPFGDQYFWGKQIEKKGIGVAPVPLKRLSVDNLRKSVENLTSDDLKTNAKNLKYAIDKEDGLLTAKRIIEEHYARQNLKRR